MEWCYFLKIFLLAIIATPIKPEPNRNILVKPKLFGLSKSAVATKRSALPDTLTIVRDSTLAVIINDKNIKHNKLPTIFRIKPLPL